MDIEPIQLENNPEFIKLSPERQTAVAEQIANQLNPDKRGAFLDGVNKTMERLSRDAGIGRIYNEDRVIESMRSMLPQDFDKLDDEAKVEAIDSAREQVKEKAAEIDPVNKNDTAFYADMNLSAIQRKILGKDVGFIEDKAKRFTAGLVGSVTAPFSEEGTTAWFNRNLPTNPEMDKDNLSKLAQGAGDFVGQIAQFAAISALAAPTGGASYGLLGVRAGAMGSRIALAASTAQNISRKFQENYNLATGEMGLSEDKAIEAGVAGMPGAVIDSFGEALILRGIKLGSAGKAFSKMSAAEKAAEIVAKGKTVLKDPSAMKTLIGNTAKGFLQEGLTESLGDAATAWGGYATTGHEGFKPTASALWDSFWIGGVLGGVAGGALGTRGDLKNQRGLKELGSMDQESFMSMAEETQNAVAQLMDQGQFAEAARVIGNFKKQQELQKKQQEAGDKFVSQATGQPAQQPQQQQESIPVTPEQQAEEQMAVEGQASLNAELEAVKQQVNRPMDVAVDPTASKLTNKVQRIGERESEVARLATSPIEGSALTVTQLEKALTTEKPNGQTAAQEEVPANQDQGGNVPETGKEGVSETPQVPLAENQAAAGSVDVTPKVNATPELVQAFVAAKTAKQKRDAAKPLISMLVEGDEILIKDDNGETKAVKITNKPTARGKITYEGGSISGIDALAEMDNPADLFPKFSLGADSSPVTPESVQTPDQAANVVPESNLEQPEAKAQRKARVRKKVKSEPESVITPDESQAAIEDIDEIKSELASESEEASKSEEEANSQSASAEQLLAAGVITEDEAKGQSKVYTEKFRNDILERVKRMDVIVDYVVKFLGIDSLGSPAMSGTEKVAQLRGVIGGLERKVNEATTIEELSLQNKTIDTIADRKMLISDATLEKVKSAIRSSVAPDVAEASIQKDLTPNQEGRLFQKGKRIYTADQIDETTPEYQAMGPSAQALIKSLTPQEFNNLIQFLRDLKTLGIDQSVSDADKQAAVEIERSLKAGEYAEGLNDKLNQLAPSRAIFQKQLLALKGFGSYWKMVTMMQFDTMAINWLKTGGSIQSFYARFPEVAVQTEFSGQEMIGTQIVQTNAAFIAGRDRDSGRQIIQEDGATNLNPPTQIAPESVTRNRATWDIPFSPIPNKIILTSGHYRVDTLIHEMDHNLVVTGMAQRIVEATDGGVELWNSVLAELGMKRDQYWTIEAHERFVEARAAWMRQQLPESNVFSRVFNMLKDFYLKLYGKGNLTKNRNITLERAFERIYSIDSLTNAELKQKTAIDIGTEAGMLLGHIPYAKLPAVQRVAIASKLISKSPEERAKYIRQELGNYKSQQAGGVGKYNSKAFSSLEIDAVIAATEEALRGAEVTEDNESIGPKQFEEKENYNTRSGGAQPQLTSEQLTQATEDESVAIDGRLYFSILSNQWRGFDAAVDSGIGSDSTRYEIIPFVQQPRESNFSGSMVNWMRNQWVGFEQGDNVDSILYASTESPEAMSPIIAKEKESDILIVESPEVVSIAGSSIIRSIQSNLTDSDISEIESYTERPYNIDSFSEIVNQYINGSIDLSGAIKSVVEKVIQGARAIYRNANAALGSAISDVISASEKILYQTYIGASNWSSNIVSRLTKDFVDWVMGVKFPSGISDLFSSISFKIPFNLIASFALLSTAPYTGQVDSYTELSNQAKIESQVVKKYTSSKPITVSSGTRLDSVMTIEGPSFPEVEAKEQSETIFSNSMPPDNQVVLDYINETGDNNGMPYIIVSKKEGVLRLYDGNGELKHKARVLLGNSYGDEVTAEGRTIESIQSGKANKVTVSGRFETATSKSAEYGEVIPTKVFGDSRQAIHTVCLKFPHEKRAERLQGKLSNRISFGCINVFKQTSEELNNAMRDGGVVYVIPDSSEASDFVSGMRQEKIKQQNKGFEESSKNPIQSGLFQVSSQQPSQETLNQLSQQQDNSPVSNDALQQLGGMYHALRLLNKRLGGVSPISGNTLTKLDKAMVKINDALNREGGKSKKVTEKQKQDIRKLIRKSFIEAAEVISDTDYNRLIKDAQQYAFTGEALSGDSFNPSNNIRKSKDMSESEKERYEIQKRIKAMTDIIRKDLSSGTLRNLIRAHIGSPFHEVSLALRSLFTRGIDPVLSAFNMDNHELIMRFTDQVFLFAGKETVGDPQMIEDFLATIKEVENEMFEHLAREFVAYNELYFVPDEDNAEVNAILANFDRMENESAMEYFNRLSDMQKQIEAVFKTIQEEGEAEGVSPDEAKAKRAAKIREKRETVINKNQNDLKLRFPTFEDYLADKEQRHGGAHSDQFNDIMRQAYEWATTLDSSMVDDSEILQAHNVIVTLLTGGNHSAMMTPYLKNKREELTQSWKDTVAGLYERVRDSRLVRPLFVASDRQTWLQRQANAFDRRVQANLENFNVWVDRFSKYPAVRKWMNDKFFADFEAGAFIQAQTAAKNSEDRVGELAKLYNDDIDTTDKANPYLWVVGNLLQIDVGVDPRDAFRKNYAKLVNAVNPEKVRTKANSDSRQIRLAEINRAVLDYMMDGIDQKSDTAWDDFNKVAYDRMGEGNAELSAKRAQLLTDLQNLFLDGMPDQIFITEVLRQQRFVTVNNYLPMLTDRVDGTFDKLDIDDMDANRPHTPSATSINKDAQRRRKATSPDRVIQLDIFKSVQTKLYRNALDTHALLPAYFLKNEIFKFKQKKDELGVLSYTPASPLVREIWGDTPDVKGQIDLIQEKIVEQMTQIYRMTEPPNSLVSGIRTANAAIQRMMLSGIGQIFQQAGAAVVDYSARESGNSQYLVDSMLYLSKNYEKVREWLKANNRDLYDRVNTQGILENEKHFKNLGSEITKIDALKDKMDTIGHWMTLSLRYGDKIGAELIFVAEHMKAVERAGLIPDIRAYDIEMFTNPALTAQAASSLNRFIGPSSAAGRSWYMSDHKQAYSLLRALTGSFQSSAHNMSSQMLGAARNYMDLMKDGSPESKKEARAELRKIGSIMGQQATFTTLRHAINGMLVLAMVSAIRSAFDDEDDAVRNAQLALDEARKKRGSKAEVARAVNEAERALSDAKAIRRAVVNMKQQTSADAWMKGMIRDQVANLHIINSFGDSFVPKLLMIAPNAIMEENFKTQNKATVDALKKNRSEQIRLGNREKVAELEQKIADLQSIDYIPLFYEKKEKSGFGGIVGGVLDPVYSAYKEAAEDIARDDKDFLTARAFVPDMITYMSVLGLGQADVNRFARQLQRIDDELSKNRLEEKERQNKDMEELTNKSGKPVKPTANWESMIRR